MRGSALIALVCSLSAAALVASDCSPATLTDCVVIGGQKISQALISAYITQFRKCMTLFPGATNYSFRTSRLEEVSSCMFCMDGDCLMNVKLPSDSNGCRYYRGPDCRVYVGRADNMAEPCKP